jgi:hypothetical protein
MHVLVPPADVALELNWPALQAVQIWVWRSEKWPAGHATGGRCAQILKPAPCDDPSEWNANVVVVDTSIKAGKALTYEVEPQNVVPLSTWR